MNAKGRKELQCLIEKLDDAKTDLEYMQEDEQSKLDNMPEGLQESEQGERIQSAVDSLESAVNSLEEAIDYLQDAIDV